MTDPRAMTRSVDPMSDEVCRNRSNDRGHSELGPQSVNLSHANTAELARSHHQPRHRSNKVGNGLSSRHDDKGMLRRKDEHRHQDDELDARSNRLHDEVELAVLAGEAVALLQGSDTEGQQAHTMTATARANDPT